MISSDGDDVLSVVRETVSNNNNPILVKDIQSEPESDCDDPEKIDFEGEHISDSDNDEGQINPDDW